MNKSFSISIGGMVFFIEDLAYEQLKSYLASIRYSLKNEEDNEEIMQDIEQRIAELFKAKLGTREVINLQDVEHIVSIMGQPEDFATDNDDEPKASQQFKFGKNYYTGKQLFRDSDHKVIGGVASGISKYLGIDPIIMRLFFLLPIIPMFFDFGISFSTFIFIYIILWIIIPEAKTTSDKLKMQGKPVNIDNIKESFNINVNELQVKENLSNIRTTIKSSGKQVGNAFEQLLSVLGKILKFLFGLILISLGITSFILFIALAIPSHIDKGINTYELVGTILDEKWMLYMGISLMGILMIVPAFYFVLLGLKLMSSRLNIKFGTPLFLASIITWFIALVSAIVLAIYIKIGFNENIKKSETFPLETKADTITVYFEDFPKNSTYKYEHNNYFYGFSSDRKKNIIPINDNLEVRLSKNNNYVLEIVKETQGRDENDAIKNIENIKYEFMSNEKELVLNQYLSLAKTAKFRAQTVRVILYIPKGKYVKTKNIDYVYNSENYNDNDDFYFETDEMKENVFTIKNEILECLTCKENFKDEAYNNNDDDDDDTVHEIDSSTIQIELKKAEEDFKKAKDQMKKIQEKVNKLNNLNGVNMTINVDSIKTK